MYCDIVNISLANKLKSLFSYLSPESVPDHCEKLLVAEAVVAGAVEQREDDVHQVLGDIGAAGADLGRARKLLLVQGVSGVRVEPGNVQWISVIETTYVYSGEMFLSSSILSRTLYLQGYSYGTIIYTG